MRKVMGFVVAVIATLAVTPAANAAVPAPIGQWEHDVVTVYARNMGPGWKVDESIAAWNVAGVVQLVRVYDSAQANIKLHRRVSMPPNYAGYVLYDLAKEGYFSWCKVLVEKATPRTARAQLLQHELGHCLGLVDNYAPAEDSSIMSYDDLFSTNGPTALDYATLQFYYSLEPSYWDAPSPQEEIPVEPINPDPMSPRWLHDTSRDYHL